MDLDPDSAVNVHRLDDATLVRWVADGMRPTPIEHSIVSARMYGIAQRLADENKFARSPRRTKSPHNSFTCIPGGLQGQEALPEK